MTYEPTAELSVRAAHSERSTREMSFEVVDPGARSDWDKQISSFARANFFHSSPWMKALHACYGFEPAYLVRINGFETKVLVPLMEVKSFLSGKRGISLPFTDDCEPLCAPDSNLEDLRNELVAFGRSRGWRYLELRGGDPLFAGIEPFISYSTHGLDLRRGEAELWRRCDSSMQRAVRKARASGVSVKQGQTAEAAHTFYSLQCQTRRKHGLPPQPRRLFEAIHEHIVAPGHGMFYFAEHSGRAIAAALFLRFGSKVIFKYGASDESQLLLRANNLLMWQAITDYMRDGCAELNFGRTDMGNEGLRRFKCSFGADERPLHYYRFDYRQNRFVQKKRGDWLRVVRPVFRHMPMTLARACGDLLYRHAA